MKIKLKKMCPAMGKSLSSSLKGNEEHASNDCRSQPMEYENRPQSWSLIMVPYGVREDPMSPSIGCVHTYSWLEARCY